MMRLLIFFLLISSPVFGANGLIDSSYTKGKEFYAKGDKGAANFVFTQLLNNPTIEPAKKGQIALSIANFYRGNFEYGYTNAYLKRAEKLSDSLHASVLRVDIYNEFGLSYFDQHLFTTALSYFSISLQMATELQDTVGMTVVLINIGNVFKESKDYENALFYYNNALAKVQNFSETRFKSILLINISSVFYLQKHVNEALAVMREAESLVIQNEDSMNLAHLQVNMGLCYMDLKNYAEAKIQFESARHFYEVSNNKDGRYLCYINLFRLASEINNHQDLTYYLGRANDSNFADCNLQAQLDFETYKRDYYLEKQDTIGAYKASNEINRLQIMFFDEFQNDQLNQLKSDVNYQHIIGQLEASETDLEEEREEKNLLNSLNIKLHSQNKWIIFLSLFGMSLFIALILILIRSNRRKRELNKTLQAQKTELERKNEEILNSLTYANSMEKLLLQQMNPHFLYNALMTVDASITTGDTEFAKQYLNLFSDLLRKTLDNSRKDFISLGQEIEFLKAYIKLNAVKQGNDFDCQFIYEVEEVEDFVYTPPMLVQPFIENALVHGLYHKTDGTKKLTIQIQPQQKHILWTITDNGVGRIKSKEISKTHKGISHGVKITVDRIYWMKKRYSTDFSVEYFDLEQGTQVILKTPIVDAFND